MKKSQSSLVKYSIVNTFCISTSSYLLMYNMPYNKKIYENFLWEYKQLDFAYKITHNVLYSWCYSNFMKYLATLQLGSLRTQINKIFKI